jgi:uncharacterized protein with von Willebrand factor type A (vWA) domain
MDAKITLSFDKSVIQKAKKFADDNDISLSRLMEFLLTKVTSSSLKSIDELPLSDWIQQLSEGKVEYIRSNRPRKSLKKEFFEKKKAK